MRFLIVALASKGRKDARFVAAALAARCRICCRCLGLEVVRFVVVALASKWFPNALLPFLWSRNGTPILRCRICCRCFGLGVVPPIHLRNVAVALVSKCFPNAEIYDESRWLFLAHVWP